MLQASGMVTMPVGDKDIVNGAEVNPQPLRVSDQHITGSRIEQDAMALRFQEYRKPMLRFESRVVCPIIG